MVVVAISVLTRLSASEMWIVLGSGKAFCYIEVHKIIAAVLGSEKSLALPAFHVLTAGSIPLTSDTLLEQFK